MFHPKGPSLRELIKQGLSSTKDGYDQLAPKFDCTPFVTSVEVIEAVMAELLKENGGKKFDASIDLCTGTGAAITGLNQITSDLIFGLDYSEKMIEEARKKFPWWGDDKHGLPHLYFYCKDVLNYPSLPSFDLATCFGALGHFEKENQEKLILAAHGTLKPGGIFAFVTAEHPKWYQLRAWPYFAFDAVMRIRNRFIKPEFVMYYINFLLPEILELFNNENWAYTKVVQVKITGKSHTEKTELRLVIAKKK